MGFTHRYQLFISRLLGVRFKNPLFVSISMSLEKLKEIKVKVEEELKKYFDNKIANAPNEIAKEAYEFLKDYTLRGGKRIRTGMLVYGYGCFKEINGEIIKAAMAMELMQSYLLIHDDIMDKDELRRGKDSMHVMYGKKYDVEDKKHFGMSMAINVGDLAASLSNEILINVDFEHKDEVIKILNKVLEKVVYGQMLDVVYEEKPLEDFEEEDILNVYRLKSATYTVEGPLHMGGLLAGVGEDELKPLLDYGVSLGKAFQIRDDINGVFGNEEKTGKPNDSDLTEGKRTLLIIKTLKGCSEDERQFISEKLGTELNEEEAEKLRELIRKYALDYCEELCDNFITEAKEYVKDLELKEEGKTFLLEIAEYVAKRDH